MENGPIIKIENLHKSFDLDGKRIDVLKGIDLELRAGEKVSIMGKSGTGKSTLLHLLGTLDRPSKGNVIFEGRDVLNQSEGKLAGFRNRTIGFVFQFHYLLPDFTALENVEIPLKISRMPPGEVFSRAKRVLEQVGLGERLNHRPGELSGGEQQRVAIARAIVMEPKILLADEPTGNLDDHTSEGIHELFGELNELHDSTIVVVTHNLKLANRMERLLLLADGKLSRRESDDAAGGGVA